MNCERYVWRSLAKMFDCNKIYGKMIFPAVAHLDTAEGLETMEHFREVPADGYHTIKSGDTWGGPFSNLWIRFTLTVPEEARGKSLYLAPKTGAYETLCFKDGKPSGIINSKNDFTGGMHCAIFVCQNATPGDTYEIAFECYAGHFEPGCSPYANYAQDTATDDYRRTFSGIDICIMDEVVKDFYYDFQTVLQMAQYLPKDNFQQKLAHECVDKAFPHLIQYPADGYSTEEIHESLRRAGKELQPALAKGRTEHTRGHFGLVGHSHMDTAWLWPLDETVRKCARTYSEALALMELYPEYTFIQSSALHADWMRRYYPTIFADIQKRVAEGRYEPNGAVWVECDCNITGGEYMIRQFLYGQRFTEKYYGYRSDCFWLPDTFGYNAAIPQIMKGCGVDYFCTTKMDWNDLNKWPLSSFYWRGMDGSEVLTHMALNHQMPDVRSIHDSAQNDIREKRSDEAKLMAFGYGDGGGGPTYGMIEFAKRVTGDVGGIPESHFTTVSRFMKDLPQWDPDLPVYDAELYLEYHRGTLTQMAQIKRNNRLAEYAIHNMEFLNVLSGKPRLPETDEYVKLLLTNQFHDILPGTAIKEVNQRCFKEVEDLIHNVNGESTLLGGSMTDGDEEYLTLFNTAPVDRTPDDILTLDGSVALSGTESQSYVDVLGRKKTDVFGLSIPAYGAVSAKKTRRRQKPSAFTANGEHLETPFYSVTFDGDGYIASLVDKRVGREIRRPGGAPLGTFYFGEDMPVDYDNWEIEWDAAMKQMPLTGALLSREVILDGHLEYRIRTSYRLSQKSTFTVDTVFYAKNPRIDYHLLVDWNERHRLFKVGFDVAVKNPYVKNEIQFGFVERPTTRNNSLECARFEVCNHKWSDLSESRYGVALLNDCKYGIGVLNSDMRLTLHRGGIRPDPTGDKGVHEMRYSLLPHTGTFSAEAVTAPAYKMNMMPVAVPGALRTPLAPLVSVSEPNVLCETVKTAEDDPDAYVVRLFECERAYTNCRVKFSGSVSAVIRTNMLEEELEPLVVTDGTVELSLRPFEIVTLTVRK